MYCLNIVSVSLEFYSQTNVYACVWPVCTDDLQLLCLHTQTINPVYTSASLGSCLQAVQAGWPEVCSTRPSTNVGEVFGKRGNGNAVQRHGFHFKTVCLHNLPAILLAQHDQKYPNYWPSKNCLLGLRCQFQSFCDREVKILTNSEIYLMQSNTSNQCFRCNSQYLLHLECPCSTGT